MIDALKALFRPRNRRLIYRYWNGARYVWADPLDLWMRLSSADLDWEEAFEEAERGNREKIREITDTLTRIFNAVPFDPATGRGLTLWELIDVMDGFVGWLDALKKKHNDGPMPLLLSAWGRSNMQEDAASADTSCGADCASTASASNADAHGTCCSQSAKP